MQYTYSTRYGDRSVLETRHRLRDAQGDEMLWHREHDAAVDKGLVQNMKEEKYSFDKLLKVLRQETVKAMHAGDKWREPACTQLEKYTGPGYACAEDTPLEVALRWYWYDHLGVSHTG